MKRRSTLIGCALAICFGAIALSDDIYVQRINAFRLRAQKDVGTPITVDINKAPFKAGLQDDPKPGKQKLCYAWVEAGGRQIALDWSGNPKAERELAKNATLQHGDSRVPCANVRGTMTFTTRKTDQGDEFYPVILVEMVTIELVQPGTIDGLNEPRINEHELQPTDGQSMN